MVDTLAHGKQTRIIPTRMALFLTFLKIGAVGFGGVGPWARHVVVEERRWLTDREYAELLAFCQVLPGPNVGNVSVMIGDRFHGTVGSVACLVGLMTGPFAILFVVGLLYDRLAEVPAIQGAITGVAAAAAGLFIGMALRMAERLKLSVAALAIVACAFVAVGLLRWPLTAVLLVLAPVSIAFAWRYRW
jgi:chromate transporter